MTESVEKLCFGVKSNFLNCFNACNDFRYEGAYHKRILLTDAAGYSLAVIPEVIHGTAYHRHQAAHELYSRS